MAADENVAQTVGRYIGKVIFGGIAYGAVYGAAFTANNLMALGISGELVAAASGFVAAVGITFLFVK